MKARAKALAIRTLEAVWMAVAVTLVMGTLTYAGAWTWLNHTDEGQQVQQAVKVFVEIDLTVLTDVVANVEVFTQDGGLVDLLEKWDRYLEILLEKEKAQPGG